MKTELSTAMSCGLFVDVVDEQGQGIAQAVFVDWRGKPFPSIGDRFFCEIVDGRTLRKERVFGRVTARQIETQIDSQGEVCVWARVRLVRVEASSAKPMIATPSLLPKPRVEFSLN